VGEIERLEGRLQEINGDDADDADHGEDDGVFDEALACAPAAATS